MKKDFETRNTRGSVKMARRGQRVPFWMGCASGLDMIALNSPALFYARIKNRATTGYRPSQQMEGK